VVGCLAGWLFGWLVSWLVGWLVGWLAGWLVGWSVLRPCDAIFGCPKAILNHAGLSWAV
jgi:hypothetical protein